MNSVGVKLNFFGPVINLTRVLLDFIYPPVCLICKEIIQEPSPDFSASSKPSVCNNCWNNLEIEEKPFCPECKVDLEFKRLHHCSAYLNGVYALGVFDEDFQELIHHFKYFRKISLGKRFGQRLAFELKSDNTSFYDFIILVPLHKVRKRERGFNQSEVLAETLAGKLNLQLQKDILIRIRNTKDQTKLSEAERKQNVSGAFQVQDKQEILKDKRVILVDDVITTGATLNECAKVLKQAGVKEILAVTIAKAS